MPSLAPSPMLSRSSTIACNSGSNIRACICGSVAAKVRLNVGLRYWSRSGMPALGTAMTPMLYGPPPRSPLSRRIEGAMVPRREGIIGDLASLLQQCGRSLERQTGVLLVVLRGGGRGIRTPGTVSRTAVFKTARFNRSLIPPQRWLSVYQRVATETAALTSDFALRSRARCRVVRLNAIAEVNVFQRDRNHGSGAGRSDVQDYNLPDDSAWKILDLDFRPFGRCQELSAGPTSVRFFPYHATT